MSEKIIKTRKKKAKNLQAEGIVRYFPTIDIGLTLSQVEERKLQKLSNNTKIKASKSYFAIFAKNIFTFFNFIWMLIAIALICVQSYRNLLFLVVIVLNTALAIIQEIRAKRTVEKMSLVTAPKIKVVREGQEIEVMSDELVLDDIMILSSGDQIPTDCIIVDGKVEVNESLLTGESNAIVKSTDDPLLSGSFLVSGLCYARVEKVGKDNYIYQMAARAKEFKAPESNLFKDLNRFIKYIGIILIPLGALAAWSKWDDLHNIAGSQFELIKGIVDYTSGALTSMIPAGMFLLVTVGLAVGVIKLAKKKTLVKDLYSIEMLARTNVLCLDKTGTITDGSMDVVELKTFGKKDAKKLLSQVLYNQKSQNATSKALIKEYGVDESVTAVNKLEFSSQRKYSITELEEGKVYFLGAVTRIKCHLTPKQKEYISSQASKGLRVIALTEYEGAFSEDMEGSESKLLALISLEEHIREKAVETIEWFKSNGVQIKIISGDDPATVSKIAQRVGVENSDKYISLENYTAEEVASLANQYTVFGRVTPEQKYVLVKTLKNEGKVVAMTGDGVNDTLALKEADCSIAMADGSEVARSISKLVLMDSNFTSLPSVVREGRQVVNNVQNSSSLFVMKTFFAILLTIVTCAWRTSGGYPFQTVNMLLLEMFVIGIPSFILTLEPNDNLIKGDFMPQVFKRSIPRALFIFLNVILVMILKETEIVSLTDLPDRSGQYITLLVMVLTFTGFLNLVSLCFPLTKMRLLAMVSSVVLIIAGILIKGDLFMLTDYSGEVWKLFGIIMGYSVALVLLYIIFRKQLIKLGQKLILKLKKKK